MSKSFHAVVTIDPTTNKATLWGFWNPSEVNDNPEHYSERGTNSLGILAYLASAYSVTRNNVYKKMFKKLATGKPASMKYHITIIINIDYFLFISYHSSFSSSI